MPMTKSQNKNSSEYVTISTAPFLSSGSKRSCPRKEGPTARIGGIGHYAIKI